VGKHFNADFFVTCATVIPVLFLALVVQGGTYESMLRSAVEAANREPGRGRDGAVSQLLPAVAYLTLMAGVIGEAGALWALFNGRDTKTDRAVVLVTTLFLLTIAAAGPAWRFFRVQDTVSQLAREHSAAASRAGPGPDGRTGRHSSRR
jgi:hypothetical protein